MCVYECFTIYAALRFLLSDSMAFSSLAKQWVSKLSCETFLRTCFRFRLYPSSLKQSYVEGAPRYAARCSMWIIKCAFGVKICHGVTSHIYLMYVSIKSEICDAVKV